MTTKQKAETLRSRMLQVKFPYKYFVKQDEIKGNRFAIVSNDEINNSGGINIHSNFMSYEEFCAYLFGWYDSKNRKFKA